MSRPTFLTNTVTQLGKLADQKIRGVESLINSCGGIAFLLGDTLVAVTRALFDRRVKLGRTALIEQMVRVGVDSIGIVVIVQLFIGCILALQLAPTLEKYGQLDQVATVVAIAVIRELGPLITAIVLSGFAGASIAAELGAMVEAEEVKALRAHALDPIQFLVVPRFLATVIMIIGLSVVADVVGIIGGMLTGVGVLELDYRGYLYNTQMAVGLKDFLTGLFKAGVFGALVSLIAAYKGLHVKGGAVGVGQATTATVVVSIVAIIGTDAIFTAVFYAFGW